MESPSSVTYAPLSWALMESSNPVVRHIALIKPQDKPEIMNLGKGLAGIEGVAGGTGR